MCFLGLDGGASKTAAVILAEDGHVLSEWRGPATNIIGNPPPQVCSVLHAAVESLCRSAGIRASDIRHAAIGLNGVDFADEIPQQTRAIAQAVGLTESRITLVNDGLIALWGASSSPQAVILQHGSGVTAAYRSNFGAEQPYDHLNVGKLFDFRRELLKLTARMIDGRVPATPLKNAVLEHFGVAEDDFCEAVYRQRLNPKKTNYVLPILLQAGQAGDSAAANLLTLALQDYALTATIMAEKAGGKNVDVCFGGGVIQSLPTDLLQELAAKVRERLPDARVKQPALPPHFGAAVSAAFAVGLSPRDFFANVEKARQAN